MKEAGVFKFEGPFFPSKKDVRLDLDVVCLFLIVGYTPGLKIKMAYSVRSVWVLVGMDMTEI